MIGKMPAFRADPTFQHLRIGPFPEHYRAVVALEHYGIATPEAFEHRRRNLAGIRTARDGEVAFADDESAGLERVVRGREGLDLEPACLAGLTKTADLSHLEPL